MEFQEIPKYEEAGGEPKSKDSILVTVEQVLFPTKETELIPACLQAKMNHQEYLRILAISVYRLSGLHWSRQPHLVRLSYQFSSYN